MSEEKRTELNFHRWQENKSRALSHKWYAIARIDLLVISISGAGIYLTFELMKYFQGQGQDNFLALKIAGFIFTLAIVTNFFSQFFGYNANEFEARYANIHLRDAIGEQVKDECDLKILNDKIKTQNFWVNFCNITSALLMVAGVAVLVVYNFINL